MRERTNTPGYKSDCIKLISNGSFSLKSDEISLKLTFLTDFTSYYKTSLTEILYFYL